MGKGPFMIFKGKLFTKEFGRTEPVPEMVPPGLLMVQSILATGWMIILKEKGPTSLPMEPNIMGAFYAGKNMAEGSSRKPMVSSVMMVNGRMVKGLEEAGSAKAMVPIMKENGFRVNPMARGATPMWMARYTQVP